MHLSCAVHCGCMSICNADQTRPDQTRPDPFYLSPLRVITLLLLPQLQKAVHRLWKSAIEEVDGRVAPNLADCELPRPTPTTEPTEETCHVA